MTTQSPNRSAPAEYGTSPAHSYTGAIKGADENRAAHGCCCYVDTRHDGHTRKRNVNGTHEETGPWRPPGLRDGIHVEKYQEAYRARKLRIYDYDKQEWCTPWQVHVTRYNGLRVFYHRGPKLSKWIQSIHAGQEFVLRVDG